MMGTTHKLGGFCTGIMASAIMTQLPLTTEKLTMCAILVGGSVVGSLLPDIDHTNSTMGKKHKVISKCTNVLFGHRGITHAPLVYFLLFGILFNILNHANFTLQPFAMTAVFGLFLGIMSHLALDIITKSGIPIMYPFSKEKVHIAKFRSDKDNGKVSLFLLVITVIVVFLQIRIL